MCIIAYKPTGTASMDKITLAACWENNDDGAGFAWYNKESNLWEVRKGFMTFKKFWKAYKLRDFQLDDSVICHFRIGTAGLKDEGNTHPFPVVENLDEMRAVNFACESILFHNGIVGRGEGDYSDTMIFVRDFVAPIIDKLGVHDKIPGILQKIFDGGSRWIVTKGDKLWKFGYTWQQERGWFFSNASFKPKTSTIYYASSGMGFTGNYSAGAVEKSVKNPNWADYKGGYANEFGRMVGNTWKRWGEDDVSLAHTADFAKVADASNKDGTVNFAVARIRKGKAKKKDKEKEAHSSVLTGAQLFCVLEEDGTVEWGDKSLDYIKSRGSNFLICPNCFEDKYIGSYERSSEITICATCGSIFEDATGTIIAVSLSAIANKARKTFEDATKVDKSFGKLTPAEKQEIIDAQTDELLANRYM
jgi:ribosomal protein S27E